MDIKGIYHADANRYSDAEALYKRCGKSGILLPKISLGFWHNFGEVDPYERSRAITHYAFDHGITHFDLANNYGPPIGSGSTVVFTRKYIDCSSIQYIEVLERTN